MKKLFDGHCDVLFRMWENKDRTLFYQNTEELHSSFKRLQEGRVKVQTMAVYVPHDTPKELRHYTALQMLDLFHTDILAEDSTIQLLSSAAQLKQMNVADESLYVLLSMEGADALQGDLTYLRTYYQLGVRSLGLVWNYRNEVADGVLERNPAGLSSFGLELVKEMNRLNMAIDVSHLAEKGFWDCIEYSAQPIIASHSNARAICEHPRNLSDDQIKAIFRMKGLIGINFVPYFLKNEPGATIEDILKHLDYMLSLGGEDYIGFGSDFDGISATVVGLEHSGKIQGFIDVLYQYYSASIVSKLVFENWRNYYLRIWADPVQSV